MLKIWESLARNFFLSVARLIPHEPTAIALTLIIWFLIPILLVLLFFGWLTS